jgi:DNA-binding MarR family transcriptional regulator
MPPPTSNPYLGALLRVVWQWVRDQIQADVMGLGYDDLSNAHLHVFRYPSPDGLRPSELAAELQLSKQSVNDLLGHLEEHGYIVREPDPADGRGRVVRLTDKGRRLERTVANAARSAEIRIGEMIGPERSAELRRTLEALADELDGFERGAGRDG